MTTIVGKYLFEKGEGFAEFMSKIGGTTDIDAVKAIEKSKPAAEFTFSDGKYKITIVDGNKTMVNAFELGKEFEEIMSYGGVVKTVITKEGNNLTFESSVPQGNDFTRVFEFTPEGFVVYLSEKKFGAKSTRWYKRI